MRTEQFLNHIFHQGYRPHIEDQYIEIHDYDNENLLASVSRKIPCILSTYPNNNLSMEPDPKIQKLYQTLHEYTITPIEAR